MVAGVFRNPLPGNVARSPAESGKPAAVLHLDTDFVMVRRATTGDTVDRILLSPTQRFCQGWGTNPVAPGLPIPSSTSASLACGLPGRKGVSWETDLVALEATAGNKFTQGAGEGLAVSSAGTAPEKP